MENHSGFANWVPRLRYDDDSDNFDHIQLNSRWSFASWVRTLDLSVTRDLMLKYSDRHGQLYALIKNWIRYATVVKQLPGYFRTNSHRTTAIALARPNYWHSFETFVATPARALLIASRANAKSLHASWPIRTPRPSSANQDAWAAVTSKRPSARHVYTRTTSRSRLYHYQYKFSSPLSVFGQHAFLLLGSTTSHFSFVH